MNCLFRKLIFRENYHIFVSVIGSNINGFFSPTLKWGRSKSLKQPQPKYKNIIYTCYHEYLKYVFFRFVHYWHWTPPFCPATSGLSPEIPSSTERSSSIGDATYLHEKKPMICKQKQQYRSTEYTAWLSVSNLFHTLPQQVPTRENQVADDEFGVLVGGKLA